ncbi:MAG: flippase, partial [Methanophagales archaeon]|nr:flippase [Methanophagales archaeon]
KNSIYNSSGVLIGNIAGIILTIILARLLLPELFGVYHLALAVGFLLLTFTDLGINKTLIRYVAYALGRNDETLARSYFVYLVKMKLFLSLLISISIFLFAEPVAFHVFHKPSLFLPLKIIAVFTFLQSLLSFTNNAFAAFQEFKYNTIRASVYEGLRLILIPLFVLLGFSVYGALVGFCLSILGAFLILFYFLVKKHAFLFKGEVKRIDRKRILMFLSFLTIGSISATVFAYVDSIMLGIFMAVEYVGFYRASYTIVLAIAGLASIGGVLFPVFTQLEGSDLNNAFQKVFKYSTILSFPFAFGLAFIAEPLVKAIYGVEYLPAIYPLYVLSFLIIITPSDFFSTVFNAKEKPEYPTMVVIISMILNVILNYFLILRFGIIGAAVATVISRYFNFISIGILSKRVLNIFPASSSIYKPLFSSLVMVLFLYFIPAPSTILAGIGGIFIATFIYIFIMFLIRGIEKEDIKYLSLIVGQQEKLIRAYNVMNSKLQRGGK